MNAQRKSLIIIIIMLILPVLVILAEFQFDWFENVMGSYLESGNEDRPRLAKFIEQDARNHQAIEKVQTLLTMKDGLSDEDETNKDTKFNSHRVFQLENGQKLVMTRNYFLSVHKKLDKVGKGIAQMPRISRVSWRKEWANSILVRGGWLQKGELFFVDDKNYILEKISLSSSEFDLVDLYASPSAGESPFDKGDLDIYPPQQFFAMLRGFPPSLRNQVITPDLFLDFEATARRIGLTKVKNDDTAELVIETWINDTIKFTNIQISEPVFRQIKMALGEINS